MQLRKSRFLSRTWCSTWQWSAPPVGSFTFWDVAMDVCPLNSYFLKKSFSTCVGTLIGSYCLSPQTFLSKFKRNNWVKFFSTLFNMPMWLLEKLVKKYDYFVVKVFLNVMLFKIQWLQFFNKVPHVEFVFQKVVRNIG